MLDAALPEVLQVVRSLFAGLGADERSGLLALAARVDASISQADLTDLPPPPGTAAPPDLHVAPRGARVSQAAARGYQEGTGASDRSPTTKEIDMGSNADDAKGRAKEAVGDLTGNEDLEREGKVDQAGAKAKDLAERAKDKASDAIDSLKDKLS